MAPNLSKSPAFKALRQAGEAFHRRDYFQFADHPEVAPTIEFARAI
jgi:hypothetical protein